MLDGSTCPFPSKTQQTISGTSAANFELIDTKCLDLLDGNQVLQVDIKALQNLDDRQKLFFVMQKNKNNNLIRKLAKVLLPPVGTEFPGHDLLHLPDRHEIGRFPDSFENPGQLRADQRLVLKKISADQTDWTKTRSPEISRSKVKTRTMTLNLKRNNIFFAAKAIKLIRLFDKYKICLIMGSIHPHQIKKSSLRVCYYKKKPGSRDGSKNLVLLSNVPQITYSRSVKMQKSISTEKLHPTNPSKSTEFLRR